MGLGWEASGLGTDLEMMGVLILLDKNWSALLYALQVLSLVLCFPPQLTHLVWYCVWDGRDCIGDRLGV